MIKEIATNNTMSWRLVVVHYVCNYLNCIYIRRYPLKENTGEWGGQMRAVVWKLSSSGAMETKYQVGLAQQARLKLIVTVECYYTSLAAAWPRTQPTEKMCSFICARQNYYRIHEAVTLVPDVFSLSPKARTSGEAKPNANVVSALDLRRTN